MPDQLFFNQKERVLEITSTGKLTANDMKKTIAHINALQEKEGVVKVFADITQLQGLPPVSVLFDMSRKISPLVRTAVVSNSKLLKAAVFFETAALNSGKSIKVFSERSEAKEWLLR